MSSGGGASDSGEDLSPRIPNDKVSDDDADHARNTAEGVCAAYIIMFISNGGHEKKKHNTKKARRRSSTPPDRYKRIADIYGNGKEKEKGKGKAKVIALSENEEDEDHSSDSDNNELKIKKKKTSQQKSVRIADVGLSLSIVSFMWAVRIALITPVSDDMFETTNPCASSSSSSRRRKHTPLTSKHVIRRVMDTFGQAAHLLQMKLPWEDLVRAVLRIFSSARPPVGFTSFTWQPLATFEKKTKNWSWSGPILSNGSDNATFDITTPEAWGVTGRVLFKLAESFIEWLKEAADCMFSQIARLPDIPISFIQQPTLEERFKDEVLRCLKKYSICTILPRSEDTISYFNKEEALRYLIPERAFQYITADGNKKATVAPLIKCSKLRYDNFILKLKRPPLFNVVCLVRDAAARLPDGVGTIADVCSLVKDSQYVVEDVSEYLLEEAVSWALNQLYFEVDYCVEYNKDSDLWTYRHGERMEEDF